MVTNLPTESLLTNLTNFLTSLGFQKVSTVQRWEKDGVYVVSTNLTRDVSPGNGWYLYATGNDNEWNEHGVDFIHINDADETCRSTYSLESFDQLKELLIATNFMP